MARNARLFVVSGPAGVGKGTLVERVRASRSTVAVTVSATTRQPRPGEVDGVSYHFLTGDEFDRLVREGEFLEWAEVHGNRYGTLKSEVDGKLAAGFSVILEIDVQGGRSVRAIYPDVVRIFIEPPSFEVLEARLRGRGTEDERSLAIRLANAKGELDQAAEYDVRIVNDTLEEALAELDATIERYEQEG